MITIILIMASIRRHFFIARVKGPSMAPTLAHGDSALVWRVSKGSRLKMGDIIVFLMEFPIAEPGLSPHKSVERLGIKRVVGLEGDTIKTYLETVPKPMREAIAQYYDKDGTRTWTVPQSHIFVMGDSAGVDSSLLGPVPAERVLGKVLLRIN